MTSVELANARPASGLVAAPDGEGLVATVAAAPTGAVVFLRGLVTGCDGQGRHWGVTLSDAGGSLLVRIPTAVTPDRLPLSTVVEAVARVGGREPLVVFLRAATIAESEVA